MKTYAWNSSVALLSPTCRTLSIRTNFANNDKPKNDDDVDNAMLTGSCFFRNFGVFTLPFSLNEDNPKRKMASTMKMTSTPKLWTCNNVVHHLLPEKLLMTPHLDRHSTTDPKLEMISDV